LKFTDTPIAGAMLVEINPIRDHRGYFARNWCQAEFADHGLVSCIEQINVGHNEKRGTLRGMHFQAPPHEEAKAVFCPRGAVFDVVLDLRPESATFKTWYGVELSAENGAMLYVPEGCAHGYQALEDNTLLIYYTSKSYAPDAATGVRWNDPAFSIDWAITPTVISDVDAGWDDFKAE
jgi:dTDP-4-dehydrorhamnose 3,5-epimerase